MVPGVVASGGFPERSKGSDCKSDGNAFAGSNPAPPSENRRGVPQLREQVKTLATYLDHLWQPSGASQPRTLLCERVSRMKIIVLAGVAQW